MWAGGVAREGGGLGQEYRGVSQARTDGGDRGRGDREWNREWRCYYCGRRARWRSNEGRPLCDFAAKATVICYPWVIVRMTREALQEERGP